MESSDKLDLILDRLGKIEARLENGSKEILNHREACNYLGVASPTLYIYVSKGIIKRCRAGKFNRYKKDELDRFLLGQVNNG